ncbi:MAG: hypothetical protein MRY32_02035 [Rickettsiales bacterium]|nr:hypothetical protein [Rickettsiales bacterium]
MRLSQQLLGTCFTAACMVMLSFSYALANDCKEAKSIEDADKQYPKCKIYNKDKTIRDWIEKDGTHHVPPLGWMKGQPPNQSDAGGSANFFGLQKPGTIPLGGDDGTGNPGGMMSLPQNPFGGGGGGGSSGNPTTPSFPPGAGGCDKNGDGIDDRDDLNNDGVPDYADQCTMLGNITASGTGTGAPNQCGANVELESNMMSVVKNQTAAIYANFGTSQIEAYRVSGNNQNYVSSSALPEFYCRIELQQQTDPVTGDITTVQVAVKEFISPDTQTHGISNATTKLVVAMSDADAEGVSAGGGFVIMTRQGSSLNFRAPAPNPQDFTSRGVINVDPNCYTEEHLFQTVPKDFGELFIQNASRGYCTIYHHSPQEQGCETQLQYMNLDQMSMYYEPGSSITSGSVSGGSMDGTAVIVPSTGNFVADADGNLRYTGSQVYMRDESTFALGIVNGVNEQTFLDGGRLLHPSGYRILLDAPGRIRVYSDGRVQLLDGGQSEAPDGTILNIIAPNAAVQFPNDQVIYGQSLGRVVVAGGAALPAVEPDGATQPSIKVQAPFDSSFDPCATP